MNYPYNSTTQKLLNKITGNSTACYLLYGQDEYGKQQAANDIANKLLMAPNAKQKRSFSNNFLQINQLDGKAITIAQIRELNNQLSKTHNAKLRVVVINDISLISVDAANALLKNLEDSQVNTIFVLVASSIDMVLPTITSRSQMINFALPSTQQLSQYMSKTYNIDSSVAEELLQISFGSLKLAISLRDKQKLVEYKRVYELAKKYLSGSITERFIVAKTVNKDHTYDQFIKILTYTLHNQSTILNQVRVFESILRASQYVRSNVNSRLVLENLALELS